MKSTAPQTPRSARRFRPNPKVATPKSLDPPISKAPEPHKIVPRSLASDFASALPEESLDALSDLISTGSSSHLPDPTEPSTIASEPASVVAADPFARVREEIEVDVDAVATKILEDLIEVVKGNGTRIVFYEEVRVAAHCFMLLIGVALLLVVISSRVGDDVWDLPPT